MFYKFNNMVGRIFPSTQAEAYTPQGLSPLMQRPSVIIFDSKKTQVAHEPVPTPRPTATAGTIAEASSSAALGTGLGVVPSTPRYRKIMEMQNAFLKNDGRLVWQKLGGRDRMSYYATLLLMAVGTAMSFRILFKMSFPKPSEE